MYYQDKRRVSYQKKRNIVVLDLLSRFTYAEVHTLLTR